MASARDYKVADPTYANLKPTVCQSGISNLQIGGVMRLGIWGLVFGFVGCLDAGSAIAQAGWQRSPNGGYVGTGSNTGQGYERTDRGYVGTGSNAGSGWDRTNNGYAGNGQNSGGGYSRTDSGIVGTGNNAGGGWARTGNGTCVGTGSNAGKSFQQQGC